MERSRKYENLLTRHAISQVRYDNSCYSKVMMKTSAVFTLLNLIINPISARIAPPDNFYGSDALLDGYCDEAQHFISVFTRTQATRGSVLPAP